MFRNKLVSKIFFIVSHKQLTIKVSKQKHGYLIHTLSDKVFKGTVVNRALPSLDVGSLTVLTVPLIRKTRRFPEYSDKYFVF